MQNEAKQIAVLVGGAYFVATCCKEGKFGAHYSHPPLPAEQSFIDYHNSHEDGGIEFIAGSDFLSNYLRDGYLDVDREGLQPITLSFGTPARTGEGPLGLPPGRQGAESLQRKMRKNSKSSARKTEQENLSVVE